MRVFFKRKLRFFFNWSTSRRKRKRRRKKTPEMLTLSDEATTQRLDAIDKVRILLAELRDTAFNEEVLSTLPQFVACCPQSGGKSSVIRRLSGI
jgi:hypothetical protein